MPKLRHKFAKERGSWLVSEIQQAVRDRSDLDAKLQLVRSLYWMDKDPLPSLPWEGASDIHLPVVYEKIETAVPKTVNAFWGTEPVVHVRRVPEEYLPEETDNAERMLNWGVEEDIHPNFYGTSENWFRNTLRDGMSTVKIYWLQEWEKTVDIHRVKGGYEQGEMTPYGVATMEARPKLPDELLYEIFGQPTRTHGLESIEELDPEEYDTETDFPDLLGRRYEIQFIEDRRRLQAEVVIRPSEFIDEVDVHVYRMVLKHDRPCVDVIEHEDLIVPFRTLDIQEADWVAQQYWLTPAEVRKRYEEGLFDMEEEDFERLMAKKTSRQEEMEENEDLKRQKDRVLGEGVKEQAHQTATQTGDDEDRFTDNNKFLFFEIYIKDDADEDGEPVEVVYHVSYDLRCVVSCDYLSELFQHKRRPFATLKYKEVSDRWYATGMGEVLVPLNLEVNTIVNFINNNQELINNPFFFYIPAATMADPGIMEGVSPGDGIPIGDVNGVVFPKFQQEPLANLSAMDTLLLFADRITISPMSAGSPQVRNAPRTARGTLALLSEGNIQLDNIITRWQRTGWRELMHQLMGLYQDRMSEEKYILVTGDDGTIAKRRISPKDIAGRFNFTFTGNTVNTNREVLRSLAQVRYNTIMTHPDMAQDPRARREALLDFLRHFSEGVDISRLVPAMPGEGGYQHPPMGQDSENQAMLNGIQLDALPTDDHAGHLIVLERFARSAAFDTMPEDRVILFAMHAKQHQQYLQLQQSQGMQPVGPGQGNNVPTGMSQQGGTDMDALEGGVQ
jgi:hypothetical protein